MSSKPTTLTSSGTAPPGLVQARAARRAPSGRWPRTRRSRLASARQPPAELVAGARAPVAAQHRHRRAARGLERRAPAVDPRSASSQSRRAGDVPHVRWPSSSRCRVAAPRRRWSTDDHRHRRRRPPLDRDHRHARRDVAQRARRGDLRGDDDDAVHRLVAQPLDRVQHRPRGRATPGWRCSPRTRRRARPARCRTASTPGRTASCRSSPRRASGPAGDERPGHGVGPVVELADRRSTRSRVSCADVLGSLSTRDTVWSRRRRAAPRRHDRGPVRLFPDVSWGWTTP